MAFVAFEEMAKRCHHQEGLTGPFHSDLFVTAFSKRLVARFGNLIKMDEEVSMKHVIYHSHVEEMNLMF